MGHATESTSVDLEPYAERILSPEDRPLFDEAVSAAKAGALRAAYVMIWLACAESLKRRFREAQTWDSEAGKILGKIDALERDHKAVDSLLLDRAEGYGFISDSQKIKLKHIYELRCFYAHPYEESPPRETLVDAAQTVVALVLSEPVTLRHGYADRLLDRLLKESSFLDDFEPAVLRQVQHATRRMDKGIHAWFLDTYWAGLEDMAGDSSLDLFVRRGLWFSWGMLNHVGVDLFDADKWHDRISKYPTLLTEVCASPQVFCAIGSEGQDSVVGRLIEISTADVRALLRLEKLNDAQALSRRQVRRYKSAVSKLSIAQVQASSLRTGTCFVPLISALASHNWYRQNPAVEVIEANGADQAAELSGGRQEELGRNLLQAAEGSCSNAVSFLETLTEEANVWPIGVIRGIFLESFTNESDEIRLKIWHLDDVLSTMERVEESARGEIVQLAADSVLRGSPKGSMDRADLSEATESLLRETWSSPLATALSTKFARE